MTRKRTGGPSGSRLALMTLMLLVGLAAVAGRVAWIQGFQSVAYAQMAARQRVRDMELTPRRGAIFDREGEILATTVPAKTIYAVPSQVKDKHAAAEALAKVLGGNPTQYLKQLHRKSAFTYIARKVDVDRAAAVDRLGLAGLGQLDDSRRSYPSGELACQVLGFVGVDDRGLSGLEAYYNDVLGGKVGHVYAERDPSGRYVLPGGVMRYEQPVDGRSLTLTIDKDIQYQAHVELLGAVKKYKAKGGSVVVMDPRTGEVYAMASTPNFNPNFYSRSKVEAYRNKPVTDTYEPGSTIKSFTAAAVIEEKLYEPDSKFNLPSTIRVGGRTIHESHGRGAVRWTLTKIVTKSSNVGAVKLGLALGKRRLYSYFSDFGLTSKTGIDFPGEVSGYLLPPSQWSASTIGNVPFGQGLSVTPVQIARGLSALANDGVLVTPHLLVKKSGETTSPVWPTERAVSPETAATMTGLLAGVVKDGTGDAARVAGYEVAGKTGTAQKAGRGGYAAGLYIGSFAGYLPASDPRVLIVVTIDEPRGGYYGGTCAAPAFSRIAKFCMAHLNIPPAAGLKQAGEKGAKGGQAPAKRKKTVSAAKGDDTVSKGAPGARETSAGVLESDDPDR